MNHSLNDDRKLKSMGMSWFVSYCYYQRIDPTHLNWQRTPTAKMRIAFYNSSTAQHKDWLLKVIRIDELSLNKNTIGLSGIQVKAMAKELLAVFQGDII